MHEGTLWSLPLKNSDGSHVDLSMVGEHTPCTIIHTAKLVGRSDIVAKLTHN